MNNEVFTIDWRTAYLLPPRYMHVKKGNMSMSQYEEYQRNKHKVLSFMTMGNTVSICYLQEPLRF